MVAIVSPKNRDSIRDFLKNNGEEVYVIGKVERGEKGVELWEK